MSSSYLKRAAFLFFLAAPAAWAQQGYFIPAAEVTAERNTNRELAPDFAKDESNVYKGTLSARTGRVTSRSQTELRPRVVFQEFADREGVDPLEYFLDLRHDYRTVKSLFSLTAAYARQDTINAEFGDAVFDDGDPTTPPPPATDNDSGIIVVGQTRQTYSITPTFDYTLTERMSLGATLQYQAVRYDDSSADSQRVGFDSPLVELNLIRKTGPRTAVTFGPYASRYEPDEDSLIIGDSLQTDTYGLRLGLDHEWSEISKVTIALRGERNDTTCDDCLDPAISGTSTEWGVEILGVRMNRVGSVRYGIGRFLTPSTLGGRRKSDQIQLQYERPLSEKLSFRAALRLSRDEAIGASVLQNDRDRIRSELALSRLLTPTWYVAGGYRYAWQDVDIAVDNTDNHTVFLSIGFKGRDPRPGAR